MTESEWHDLSWPDFCLWLQDKRVAHDTGDSEWTDGVQTLTFADGSVAEMRSEKTDGSPGYSEYTPGSDGHLVTPKVRVKNAPKPVTFAVTPVKLAGWP